MNSDAIFTDGKSAIEIVIREKLHSVFFSLSSGFFHWFARRYATPSWILIRLFLIISLGTRFDLAWYFNFFKVIEIRSFPLFFAPQYAD